MVGKIEHTCQRYNPLYIAYSGIVYLEKNQYSKIATLFISIMSAFSAYFFLRTAAIVNYPVAHIFTLITPLEAAIAAFAISYIFLAIVYGIGEQLK